MTPDLPALRAANAARRAQYAAARDSRLFVEGLDGAEVHRHEFQCFLTEEEEAWLAFSESDDAPAVIDTLLDEVARLRAGIAELRIDHRDCYSPLGDTCECGADAHNAKIAELLHE